MLSQTKLIFLLSTTPKKTRGPLATSPTRCCLIKILVVYEVLHWLLCVWVYNKLLSRTKLIFLLSTTPKKKTKRPIGHIAHKRTVQINRHIYAKQWLCHNIKRKKSLSLFWELKGWFSFLRIHWNSLSGSREEECIFTCSLFFYFDQ